MNRTFLNKLANHLKENGNDLNKSIFIFPSKRAGLYFKKELISVFEKTMISPDVLSMNEFIYKFNNAEETDSLILNYELFKIYKKVYSNEYYNNFESFFEFGNILLNDFDNIDKNLVPAKQLFKIIRDYKEIEKIFPNPVEEDEYLMMFKKASDSLSKNNKFQDSNKFYFIFWERIYELYTEFNSSLKKLGLSYEGALYRNLAEVTENYSNEDIDNIYFCGLNYLSISEIKIINNLKKSGFAHIVINADENMLNSTINESSRYLSKYHKWFNLKNEELIFISDNKSDEKKYINLYNVASESGQVNLLNNILAQNNFEPDKTAIILPEINQLIPVLNSIPDKYDSFNVTLNYPANFTAIKEFINSYIVLLESSSNIENNIYYPNDILFKFLLHPYLKYFHSSKIYKFKNDCDDYLINVSEISLHTTDEISNSLKETKSLEDISDRLISLLELIYKSFMEHSQNDLESEVIIQIILRLKFLNKIIENRDIILTQDSFKILINDIINNESISLKGDPLKGIQIMGLYETRALDFENIIILNSNEGIFPPAINNQSIIPMNLKRFYKMTTGEDTINNFAYMFYRLLLDNKNLFMIYSSDISSDSKEESRYIKQIEYEFKNKKNVIIQKKSFDFKDEKLNTDSSKIIIRKSDEINILLDRFKSGGNKFLSASSLNSYKECSLRFCFDYVLELKEPEDLTLEIDPAQFGTHIHNLMLQIYESKTEKPIDKFLIEDELKKLPETINKYLKTEYKNIDIERGKFILIKKMLQDYCEMILKEDLDYAPFNIVKLETKESIEYFINDKIGKVKFKAKIDRIDEKDGIYRIIDYKTGNVKFCKEDKFDSIFEVSDFNAQFQLYFYALLIANSELKSDSKKLLTGLYALRQGNQRILLMDDSYNNRTIERFENKLKELIVEIYNEDISFKKTENIKNCQYCSYIDICLRNKNNEE